MKRFITIIGIMAVCLIMCSCQNYSASNKKNSSINEDSIKAEFVKDSIAKAEFVRDSIANVQHNAEVIEKCKNLFTFKKDEFSNKTWVEPKSAPKYRNQNGIYCYFSTENGKAETNFRFVCQYCAYDWLFIRSIIFNIDGENVTIIPNMETDCGNGGQIWEWCDESVNYSSSGIDEEFIRKISNASTVKIKFNGRQYYDTRTLNSSQIKAIKDAYDYYVALGGKFV